MWQPNCIFPLLLSYTCYSREFSQTWPLWMASIKWCQQLNDVVVQRCVPATTVVLWVLSAGEVDKYLVNQQEKAASTIQAYWRGSRERRNFEGRQQKAKQDRAVTKLQRAVRMLWLSLLANLLYLCLVMWKLMQWIFACSKTVAPPVFWDWQKIIWFVHVPCV